MFGLEPLDQLSALCGSHVGPDQQQFGQLVVFGVEECRRDTERFGQLAGGLQRGLVNPPLILVDARTCHVGLQTGEHAQLPLRHAQTLARLRQTFAEYR